MEQDCQLCQRCCRSLPVSEFRFRSKASGRRMHQCRECTTSAQRERRRAHKSGATKRAMAKLNRQLARTTDAKRVSWLVSDTIGQLGGLHRFAASLRAHFDDVRSTCLGHRETLNTLTAIINLSAASAALNPPRRPDDMTDAELDEYGQQLFQQKLVENLEEILLNLLDQGWVIQPPPSESTLAEHSTSSETPTADGATRSRSREGASNGLDHRAMPPVFDVKNVGQGT